MLRAYKLIAHSVDKFQQYLDYIFYEIWCKPEIDFNINRFAGNSDLFQLVQEYYNSNKKDLIYLPVEKIYNHFSRINKVDSTFISIMKEKYKSNNDIEALCKNKVGTSPITYDDLKLIDADLAKDLQQFCVSLWDELFERKPMQMKIGSKKAHYEEFVTQNHIIVCQCCGLNDMKGAEQTYREAYDHYLPKSKYPFTTVNFKNLTPACDDCNSIYKKEQDPIFNGKRRRKAFYNFQQEPIDISISIEDLVMSDLGDALKDFKINISSEDYNEEVETWKELFGIEERYKEKCKKNCKFWIGQYIKLLNKGHDLNFYLDFLGDDLLYEVAFLKKPFIIAWQKENAI